MKFVKKILLIALFLVATLNAEEMIDAKFNNMNLDQFVKLVGKITEKNVLINGQLNGKVDFVSTKKIKKSSLFSLANSILASKGYALVDHGDFLEVVKASDAASSGLEVTKKVSGKLMKTVLFPLKYSNAAVIRAKIKPLLGRNAKVISFKANNMIAVTTYPKQLQTVKKLIEEIETNARKGTTIIKLKRAAVKDVYQNVQNMSKLLFPQTISSEKVGVLKDETTNALIMVGKKENVDKLLRYVKRLDVRGESVSQKMYVLPLQNSNVEEMEKILGKLVAQMNNIAPTASPIKAAAAKNSANKNTKAMVVGDKERNALIVLATPEQIKNIRAVIRRIDVAKPQVYVKAKIIEINLQKAKNVGLKYGFEGGKITSNGLFSLAGNMGAPSLMVSKSILSFLSSTSTSSDGTTTTSNPFTFGDSIKELFAIGIKMDLLQQDGAAHTLSEPSVLCTNNQEAEIYVGETRSILVSSTSDDSTTAVVRNKYSREDIGISLKVTPRLSSNNKVTLKVEALLEDIVPGSSTAADRPTTTKRKVVTNAIVNHGQTVILGGLMKSSGGKTVSKIPILGDIPILGALFTSTGYSESKVNVVIYLTPYIVRNSRDLTKLREFLSDLDGIQAKYSSYIREKLAKRAGIYKEGSYDNSLKNATPAVTRPARVRDPLDVLRTR